MSSEPMPNDELDRLEALYTTACEHRTFQQTYTLNEFQWQFYQEVGAALPKLIAEFRQLRTQWYATLIELRAWRAFAGYLSIHGMQLPAPYEDQVNGGETPDKVAEQLRTVLKQIAASHPLASGPWLTLWHVCNLAREALGRAAYHPELNTFADPELQMLRDENTHLRATLAQIAHDPYIDQNAAAVRELARKALTEQEP